MKQQEQDKKVTPPDLRKPTQENEKGLHDKGYPRTLAELLESLRVPKEKL
jgi:hypothetical protein